VWGMPGAAVKLGGAQDILPLARIPAAILRLAATAGAPLAAAAKLGTSR
jgi:chemotaxis response regulator CheB